MTPEQMYDLLKPAQEKLGYRFNPDRDWALKALAGLLTNKGRYGYASCPCRLATGKRESDRDIICPCAFREEDVRKYGRCYCWLYVTEEVARGGRTPAETVPERWLRKQGPG
jgi:ferredoxin-thioredoxin reductase catalytic subunit